MPKNINSAYRVYEILNAACHQGGSQQTWQVCAKVFGVPGGNGRKAIFEVNRLLDLFYDEVENARSQLVSGGFSQDLYEPAFETIEGRLSPSSLYGEWGGPRRDISAVLPTLKFCSEVLPHEEELVSEEDICTVGIRIHELESKLGAGGLPGPAHAFIKDNLAVIKKALRNYRVVGVKAFRTALYEGVISFLINEDVVRQNKDEQEIGLLKKIWNGVTDMTGRILGEDKFLNVSAKLAELGLKVEENAGKTP